MELNPFYQSDDDYEDEQLDISNGNVENDENGNKSKSRPQRYSTIKNEEKLKIIKVAKEIGNHKVLEQAGDTDTNTNEMDYDPLAMMHFDFDFE